MRLSAFLQALGIQNANIVHNPSPAALYEDSKLYDNHSAVSDKGALIVNSGIKTGRSPKDKRIVDHQESRENINWGDVNIKTTEQEFSNGVQTAISYFNKKEIVYLIDGYAGWDPQTQVKVRVICTRPYHALFMHNMLIRPTAEQLKDFGEPTYTILNAGEASAHPEKFSTSILLSFEKKQIVILGTEYAGEMKKAIFSVMNYIMPHKNILSMHCSANEGDNNELCLFFGLSGTGKTTLSADASRKLIGDDEHCWNDTGVFNIEGGCYAKTVNLSKEKEPEIFEAIRFGTVLENVVFDKISHEVDYNDISITENTRASYPIEFISNTKIPCIGGHPKNIVFLTCDAFGVFPPVSKLTTQQAMYHFVSGYTAKMAGTEMGITQPTATFSACFGAAFMVWHPSKYAELLASKIKAHNVNVWLVNTGWMGGMEGVGSRIKLAYTRSIINAIHDGQLNEVEFVQEAIFKLNIPTSCPGVPSELLVPEKYWKDKDAYHQQVKELANLFNHNFNKYKNYCSPEIINAGPVQEIVLSAQPY